MRLADANRLLDAGHTDLESGYCRPDDGQPHVAAWTTMFGCKGRMVEWWFGFLRNAEQYEWWHPRDHVWCEWVGEPAEYLDASRFERAGISAAVCARVGPLEAPVWAGRLIHLCRDTDYGCEMRSRFWLGDLNPAEAAPERESRVQLFPDRVGEGLLKHCHEEMSYLAGFLPGLYARESDVAT